MHPQPFSATPAYHALTAHFNKVRDLQMRVMFEQEPDRFERFSVEAAGLLLDYSKNRVNAHTMQLLQQLARERKVEERRDAMFAGEKINATEHRAVLHAALRMPRDVSLLVDGQDVVKEVHAVLDHIRAFTDRSRGFAEMHGCFDSDQRSSALRTQPCMNGSQHAAQRMAKQEQPVGPGNFAYRVSAGIQQHARIVFQPVAGYFTERFGPLD